MSKINQIRRWMDRHSTGVGLVVAVVVFIWGYEGFPVPDAPMYVWVGVASFVGTVIFGYPASQKIIDYLYTPTKIVLADINPVDGEFAIYELSEDKWEELAVTNQHGEQKSKADLHSLSVGGVDQAFEVRNYNPENNVATTTWMGGATPVDLRRYRKNLEHVEDELSKQADNYNDLRAGIKPVVRSVVTDISNWMIATAEGADVAQGGRINDSIEEAIEEQGLDDLPKPEEVKLESDRTDNNKNTREDGGSGGVRGGGFGPETPEQNINNRGSDQTLGQEGDL